VMPNHFHGILVIHDVRRGGSRTAPTETIAPLSQRRKTLGRLIGAFKTISTKRINAERRTPGQMFWQRNYYEHVIRNEKEMQAIRDYIATNPLRWHLDAENPNGAGSVDSYSFLERKGFQEL
ncbi:MAG: transposase, partial [Candidatus Tectomicrobia bacterium]|nr:transposase [Candidatus Tectomicrobia bacterium]